MQTIIHKTDSYSDTDNVVFPVTDLKNLETELFSTDELSYMETFYKEHKQRFFTFNRLSNVLFVCLLDKERDENQRLQNYREQGAKLQAEANTHKLNALVIVDREKKPEEIMAFAEGLALRNYQFLKYKTKASEQINALGSIYILSKGLSDEKVETMNILVDACSRSRNMVNEPVAYMNALKIAEEFEKMGKDAGARVEVLNKKKIEALKMGGLLAVNKGSVDPPTFTIMEWKPKDAKNKKPFVFVGKGVVYDTGGMNIKTGNFMNDMKMDMAGGAAVAGALYAIARARIPIHVIAIIPATDNRVNGNAYVSGDVITMHDGTTVEVINTDAEGRMLLADALSYAKKYKPQLVIDVATLTGSAMRAIGIYGIAAMQSKARSEYKKLAESGEKVYERLVELPFWKEYEEELKSDIADIKHLGGANAGAITAGKFLEHFTDYPYVHLDIAGPAYLEKPFSVYTAGATGMAVRLLFQFIKSKSL
ncbi:MAG: leucyl aminopeptidase family protein [Bacteroidetes bacterium]|nr:leucyl aminopeptidase family protein [Bacteroidota bacterium]